MIRCGVEDEEKLVATFSDTLDMVDGIDLEIFTLALQRRCKGESICSVTNTNASLESAQSPSRHVTIAEKDYLKRPAWISWHEVT